MKNKDTPIWRSKIIIRFSDKVRFNDKEIKLYYGKTLKFKVLKNLNRGKWFGEYSCNSKNYVSSTGSYSVTRIPKLL